MRQTPDLRKDLDKTGDISRMLFFPFGTFSREEVLLNLSQNILLLQIVLNRKEMNLSVTKCVSLDLFVELKFSFFKRNPLDLFLCLDDLEVMFMITPSLD